MKVTQLKAIASLPIFWVLRVLFFKRKVSNSASPLPILSIGHQVPKIDLLSANLDRQKTVMEVNHAKLYDRQIQIFGTDTQKDISSSEVLISGLNTVTQEVAKNLALIGFGIALHDAGVLTPSDIRCSPLLGACDDASVGQPLSQVIAAKLRDINPHIQVRVVEHLTEASFQENSRIFVSMDQSFEVQISRSMLFQNIDLAKFFLFQIDYKFMALAELPDSGFRLSSHTPEQLQEKLSSAFDFKFDFGQTHTPSVDDFVLQCVYGATFNQALLTLVSRKKLGYNLLFLDTDSQSDNPNHHRRLECLSIN